MRCPWSAGLLVIYAGGAARLAFGPPAPLGLPMAMSLGVYPFVVADAIKVAAAAGIMPAVWRWLGGPSLNAGRTR